ncbi:MAG TPA: DUF3052 domain-containing protein [Caulobacteraceae bacterium]
MTGYSGKPLGEKLGIKPGCAVLTIGAPANYPTLVGPLPPGARIGDDTSAPNIVHVFAADYADLAAIAARLPTLPAPGGALWISWPKKSSPMFRDLTEGGVRELLLPTGWVDVKVCAVDEDWSRLKFLRRRAPTPVTTAPRGA